MFVCRSAGDPATGPLSPQLWGPQEQDSGLSGSGQIQRLQKLNPARGKGARVGAMNVDMVAKTALGFEY